MGQIAFAVKDMPETAILRARWFQPNDGKQGFMSLVRVRRAAQITLPRDIRKKLDVREDDFFDVQIVEDGLLLKPVSFVERGTPESEIEDHGRDAPNDPAPIPRTKGGNIYGGGTKR